MQIEPVTRIKLVLPQSEYSALLQASDRTLRTPDAEARAIIRHELERRGLLSAADNMADYNRIEAYNGHSK